MKIQAISLLIMLLLAAMLFSASETDSSKLRLDKLAAPNNVGSELPGYKVIDVHGNMVPPQGCGPFLHWNPDKFPDGKIPYYINRKGSKNLSLPEIKNTVAASFQSWKDLQGVALDFKFMGYTEASGLKRDGKNVIFFDETGTYFSARDKEEALGKTQPVDFDPNTGELKEVDIALNGTYIPPFLASGKTGSCTGEAFKTPIVWNLTEQRCVQRIGMIPVEYRAYLPNTLTHEIGHFLGLGHSTTVGATMSTVNTTPSFAESTEQSTLEEDDRKGAEFLYPADVRGVTSATTTAASSNIALGKPVSVTTNGAADNCLGCQYPQLLTDGSLSFQTDGGQLQPGSIGFQNNDYQQLMEVKVTIDLGAYYHINQIRYNPGNVQRAESWNADWMITPFGSSNTFPGSTGSGRWTEHNGNLTASKVTLTFYKTRKTWEEDWLFIGEIEIIGTPIENSSSTSRTAATTNRTNPNSWEGVINPRRCWQTTGIKVQKGETVSVSATGTVTWDPTISSNQGTVGPNGARFPAAYITTRVTSFPLAAASPGTLLVRIGNLIYAAGEGRVIESAADGTVELMINDEPDWLFDNSGSFKVRVQKR